jgi:hypothetical protein
MTESRAAGRKTDRTDRFEEELIAGIATGREGMLNAFLLADRMAKSPTHEKWDSFDLLRAHGNAVAHAVEIMKAIAEVTQAAAKLRGEFNHKYQVTRRIEPAQAIDAVLLPEGEGGAES